MHAADLGHFTFCSPLIGSNMVICTEGYSLPGIHAVYSVEYNMLLILLSNLNCLKTDCGQLKLRLNCHSFTPVPEKVHTSGIETSNDPMTRWNMSNCSIGCLNKGQAASSGH